MEVQLSIIVPCYNQAEFLNETLQAVFDQTYVNWECIVINDGSIDNTEEIAKYWCVKDSRFQYIEQSNSGVCAARNTAIQKATGKYILPLDADDLISINYVEVSMDTFKEDPSLKLVYCNAEKFGKIKGEWKLPEFSLANLANENIIFSSAIFKKEDFQAIGGYDNNMAEGWEDWELWISLLKNGGKVRKLNITGFHYRIKDKSRNLKVKGDTAENLYKYISVKHADFFCEHFGSFQTLRRQISIIEQLHNQQLKSEKFVIDLFLKRFFRFSIFGKYKGD